MAAVKQRDLARADIERAAVQPDHYRPFLASTCGRCPHVEEQAILALLFRSVIADRIFASRRLHAARTERVGTPDTCPRFRRLRGAPAQITDWRFGIGNSLEGGDAVRA